MCVRRCVFVRSQIRVCVLRVVCVDVFCVCAFKGLCVVKQARVCVERCVCVEVCVCPKALYCTCVNDGTQN